MYDTSLEDMVRGDTSGDQRKFLLAMMGVHEEKKKQCNLLIQVLEQEPLTTHSSMKYNLFEVKNCVVVFKRGDASLPTIPHCLLLGSKYLLGSVECEYELR